MPQYFEGQGDFIDILKKQPALCGTGYQGSRMIFKELSMGYSFNICGFAGVPAAPCVRK